MKCEACVRKDCRQGKDCFNGAADPQPHLDEEDRKIWRCASEIEAEFYLKYTRLEELIEFSKRMGYQRLGVTFCIGLEDEAAALVSMLSRDFKVTSVCCKACGIDKDILGFPKIRKDGFEATCNPVGQALLLESENTELNIIVGLCMGHDMLFTKHSKAPVTTFAVKDRVLAHNPLGAVYSGYHRKRQGVSREDRHYR